MQMSSTFDQSKSFMIKLDGLVKEVASGGKDARRSFFLTMGSGVTMLYEDKDLIKWSLETDTELISQRGMQHIGNLIIGSNLNAMAYENASQGSYVLENEHLEVHIKKIGSVSSPVPYNTTDLLMKVYNKDLSQWMDLERLEISIDNSSDSVNGSGFTELELGGFALPYGRAIAHINTSYAFLNNYTVIFTLEAGADFLTIEAEEV
jgi:hypothetical protein